MRQAEREQIDAPRRPVAPDRGTTYVELLVSIVLIGTAVVATLVAVRATTIAIRIDSDRAKADTWLLEAADRVHQAPRLSCTAGAADVATGYSAEANLADRPPAWSSGSISVIEVEFLQRTSVDADYTWGSTCFEGDGYESTPHFAQRVTIRVVLPDGSTEEMEMVKG